MSGKTSEPDESEPTDVAFAINGFVAPISNLRVDHIRRGEVIAHRETGAIRQASDSAMNEDGSVASELRGRPSQGEGATLDACEALRRTLEHRGERLYPVHLADPHDDCDCVIQDPVNAARIRIQVVRADSRQQPWRNLGASGLHEDPMMSLQTAAERIRATIQAKADRLVEAQRRNLVLALDATTTSALALGPVVREFRDASMSWCRALGFISIWLVGPSNATTYRLDERDPSDTA